MIDKKVWHLALCVSFAGACGGKKSSTADNSSSTSTTISSSVSSLKDLSIAGVLAIALPDSVKANGTSSGLRLSGSKSFEACQLRQEIKDGLSNIAEVSSTFCFLENDPSITFGKKYNIDFSSMMPEGGAGGPPGAPGDPGAPGEFDPAGMPGGPPSGLRLSEEPSFPSTIQLWIDNSTQGKLTVYFCEDKKLAQMIEVTGASSGKAKGRVIMKQSMKFGEFSMNFHRAMNFDNKYTDENTTSITVKELIGTSSSSFGSENARRLLSLSLADKGVSKVLSSFNGNFQGSDNSFASMGAFDTDFGSVIAKGKMTYGSDLFEFSNESFFDGKSFVVEASAYPAAFGADGKVKLKPESVPGYLGASFKPEEFPAGAWDCSGTSDLTPQFSESATNSCMASWEELGQENCFGETFAAGEIITIDEANQLDPEAFEKI